MDFDLNLLEQVDLVANDVRLVGDSLLAATTFTVERYDLTVIDALPEVLVDRGAGNVIANPSGSELLIDLPTTFVDVNTGETRTHPELGGASRVHSDGARLTTLSSYAFREIDTSSPATPTVVGDVGLPLRVAYRQSI